MTKNDDGRVVYLTPDLRSLLAAQLDRVEAVRKRTERISPRLFPYLTGKTRLDRRRGDFRKAWATAREKAGVAGRYRHDSRPTAVRNLGNAGVPERIAMKMTGHETRAGFDRYHIVSAVDLQEAARRIAGTSSGTSAISGVDPRAQVRDNPGTGG